MSYFTSKYGIFEGIVKNMFINNQTDKINITTSKNYDYPAFPKNSILDSSSDGYWLSYSDENHNQWLMMEFKDRWISLEKITFATVYALRPTKFIIEAYDENEKGWMMLYNYSDIETNDILVTGHILITIPEKIVMRKIRFLNKGPSFGNLHDFRIKAVDIFGAMTKCEDDCSNPIPFRTIPKICHFSCPYYFLNNPQQLHDLITLLTSFFIYL